MEPEPSRESLKEDKLLKEKEKPANKTLEELFKEKDITFKKPNNTSANNVNSQKLLKRKLDIVEDLQNNTEYIKTETTLDGKIRFFKKEAPSRTPGQTRGVAEYDTTTGNLRSWIECYDHQGNIIRIHKKNIGGLDITGPHTPPTGKDYKIFNIKPPEDSL